MLFLDTYLAISCVNTGLTHRPYATPLLVGASDAMLELPTGEIMGAK